MDTHITLDPPAMPSTGQPRQNPANTFTPSPLHPILPITEANGVRPDAVTQQPWLSGLARQDWTPILMCLLLDIAAWIALYGLLTYIRVQHLHGTSQQSLAISFIQLAVIVTVLFIIGGYDRHTNMRTLDYATEHILGIFVAAAISFLVVYSAATFDHSMKPSRGVIAISFLLFLPVSIGYRRLLQKSIAALTAKRSFLVIGSGELAAEFYKDYKASPRPQHLHFVNYEEEMSGQPVAGEGSPIVQGNCAGKLADLDHTCSGVVLAEGLDSVPVYLLERLVQTQFQRTRVYTLEAFYETHWRYVPLHTIDPFWALQTGFQLSRTSPYHYVKRICDISLAAILLVLTAPISAVVALLIRLEDRGPALFSQERAGVDAKSFTLYKFRTMVLRTADEFNDIYTRHEDPRITRVGRWVRKLRIDELPQLWNVLKGDMSLIGPRAEWVKCTERYEKKIPFYHFRHLVKPGITGWAQVNYPYGECDEDAVEKLKYDLYYIRHYSLKLDFMIVLKTVHTMLFGRGR